jgi:hypothetical protein
VFYFYNQSVIVRSPLMECLYHCRLRIRKLLKLMHMLQVCSQICSLSFSVSCLNCALMVFCHSAV